MNTLELEQIVNRAKLLMADDVGHILAELRIVYGSKSEEAKALQAIYERKERLERQVEQQDLVYYVLAILTYARRVFQGEEPLPSEERYPVAHRLILEILGCAHRLAIHRKAMYIADTEDGKKKSGTTA